MALVAFARGTDHRCMNTTPVSAYDWSGLGIMDTEECLEHLRRSPVGRLGFIDHGEAVILPVNYALDGRSIVFRTGPGSKLSAAVMNNAVCLEIDGWIDLDHTGWSVLAKGMATMIEGEQELERLDALPVHPWSSPELRQEWVRIVIEELSGRRIVHRPVPPTV
jgi:uncharacterized protein